MCLSVMLETSDHAATHLRDIRAVTGRLTEMQQV